MNRNDREYKNYVSILNEELLPAMGCTEPVAVAYAAAKAREILGCLPERCMLYVSGNIIKNVKSVVVPNTGGLKGLKAAAAAGIVAGNAELQMSVIAETDPKEIPNIQKYIDEHEILIERKEGGSALYIEVILEGEGHTSKAVISDFHTNIILLEKDGEVVFQKEPERLSSFASDHSLMSLEGMWDFINTVELEDISALLDSQINCNSAISQEGLEKPWGAQIGRILLKNASDTKTRAMARAAAGSDARMSGCEKPVVIVGGSGNQGLTVTMPVLEYAEMGKLQEVVRALRHAGAVVNPSCGLHVHVDASKHTPRSLRNLLSIMYSKEDLIFAALGAQQRRVERYCKLSRENVVRVVRNMPPGLTMRQLRRAWYEGHDGAHDHYNWSRYYALNLHSVFYHGTVEWRCFESTLHAGEVRADITLALAMSAQAINLEKTVARKTPVGDNPAFTFRTFLLRLGLIGPEYKNVRMHLLKRLPGDPAWLRDRNQYESYQRRHTHGGDAR